MLVHFVLHTPFNESLDIQPSFKLGFDFLLFLKLLIFLLFLKLPFEIDLLHNSRNCLVLFYFWLQFFLRHKRYVILQVIKLRHIPFLHVLRILYGYDIVQLELIIYFYQITYLKSNHSKTLASYSALEWYRMRTHSPMDEYKRYACIR